MAAARAVLKDWNEGKIPYFTVPPVADESHKSNDAVIVGQFAPAFDAMDAAVLSTLKEDQDEMDFVQLNPGSGATTRSEWKGFEDDDDEEMDEDSDNEMDAKPSLKQRRQQLANAEDYDFDDL